MLYEKNLFDESETTVREHFPSFLPFSKEDVFKMDARTLKTGNMPFRGSLLLANKMGKNLNQFNALWWLPRLAQYSIHKNYLFLDMKRLAQLDFESKFIKPAAGTKAFAGQVYDTKKFQTEYSYSQQHNLDTNQICLVSDPQDVIREWRTIFIDGQFVSGCQYMFKGELCSSKYLPPDVVEYAELIAFELGKEGMREFVVDIGSDNTELKLIEINALETSSFYLSDINLIYKKWAELYK
jgi:ATP-grasp domain, R2K clade family 3